MTVDTEEVEGVPAYQVELIETELERAGPDGLGKADLQAAVGLGTGDLRLALVAALAEGVAIVDGDRYKAGPSAGAAGGDPDAAGDAAAALAEEPEGRVPEAEEADERAEDPSPGPEASEAVRAAPAPSYKARIALDVTFVLDDPETEGDETAVSDAAAIAQAARDGIHARWPDLGVSSAVVSVDGLEMRRVYP